jgi:cyclopropane-fatty-acyl-phospholipid synthase
LIARTDLQVDVALTPMRVGWAAASVERILHAAGVRVNGTAPWDIRVHDDRFYRRALLHGTLGIGESYMDGWWDCDRLDELVARVLRGDAFEHLPFRYGQSLLEMRARWLNLQTVRRARRAIPLHYDLSNEFFARMLGRSMAYSCAYWAEARDLDAAQDAKHELVCRKLDLQPGDRVFDVGCGWGGFARYAAERRGCRVVGITISPAQAEAARARCLGLPVDIHRLDYRARAVAELGCFDKIVSIGMFEHVGTKNYRTFMQRVADLLHPQGRFLLHTIGSQHAGASDPWLCKYVFPGGVLPSAAEVIRASEGLFVMEDWHNFRADYDRTLLAWHANHAAMVAEEPDRYDVAFLRMWRFYLLSCAGNFRAGRHNQLWQVLYSKRGTAVRPDRPGGQ